MMVGSKLAKALHHLFPQGGWSCCGDEYESIKLKDGLKKPTKAQITRAYKRVQEEEAQNAYRDERQTAYPELTDQLDALWKGVEALIQEGANVGENTRQMLEDIQKVKQAYPKPKKEK